MRCILHLFWHVCQYVCSHLVSWWWEKTKTRFRIWPGKTPRCGGKSWQKHHNGLNLLHKELEAKFSPSRAICLCQTRCGSINALARSLALALARSHSDSPIRRPTKQKRDAQTMPISLSATEVPHFTRTSLYMPKHEALVDATSLVRCHATCVKAPET